MRLPRQRRGGRRPARGDGVPHPCRAAPAEAEGPGRLPHPHALRHGSGHAGGPAAALGRQTALRFYGRIAVDEDYNGLALDSREGERIARSAGDADVVFLKNHGVMVLGETIAEAWDDLYYLERAAQAQVLAMSTGRTLKVVPEEIVRHVAAQEAAGRAESARLHLESVKRVLARDEPAFLA